MRFFLLLSLLLTRASHAQSITIPPIQTSLNIQSQSIETSIWGTLTPQNSDRFNAAMTIDLAAFQQNLAPVLSAELNQSERCGSRLSVQRAVLTPAAPQAMLDTYVHYERFACAKAFGKEIVKRIVGGNGMVEVKLTPTVEANHIALTAQVTRIESDGSLGEVLRSGALGDSIRKKAAASIESAIQKAANQKSALPADIDSLLTIQAIQFMDGGAGKLWLGISGDLHLSAQQFQDLSKRLNH
jgi:phospholipase/lecithinase/hemolysin